MAKLPIQEKLTLPWGYVENELGEHYPTIDSNSPKQAFTICGQLGEHLDRRYDPGY
jgi:hypothetical protein